jgi:hypothetical protein
MNNLDNNKKYKRLCNKVKLIKEMRRAVIFTKANKQIKY